MDTVDRFPNHPTATPLTFNYDEAASALGRSTSWLQKQVAANAVPYRRLGRSIAFTRDDLEEILRLSYRPPVTSAPPRRRSRPGSTAA